MTETKTTEVKICPSCNHECDTSCEDVIDMTYIPEENICDTSNKPVDSNKFRSSSMISKDNKEL